MDPSFDRSQTNHFVMETNTFIPQHLWPNARIVPEIRSYLTSIFFAVLLCPCYPDHFTLQSKLPTAFLTELQKKYPVRLQCEAMLQDM
jgi:hypothetical protein